MADLGKVVAGVDYTRLWAEIRDDPGRFFLGDRSEGFSAVRGSGLRFRSG